MKKVGIFILSMIILIIFTSQVKAAQYTKLYRDVEVAGRGGAMVAVGGSVTSVFYNPAGLVFMNQNEGFEVRILDTALTVSKKDIDFAKDIKDALNSANTNSQKIQNVSNVFNDYLGDTLYLETNLIPFSIAKKHSSFAWGFGIFTHADASGIVHQGFGTSGVISVNAFGDTGVFFGCSFPFIKTINHFAKSESLKKMENTLWIGLDVKVAWVGGFYHDVLPVEIVNYIDNGTYWKDLLYKGIVVTGDAGFIFKPYPNSFWNPSIGFSILNINPVKGKNKNGETKTLIPRTYNLGFAVHPKISSLFEEDSYANEHFLKDAVIAFDIRDLSKAYPGSDWGKRLYLGGSIKLFKSRPFSLGISSGFYQGYPSYGVSMTFLILRADFVYYTEELGNYAGQKPDKRYFLSLSIRW